MDIGELRLLVVEDHGFQRWALQRQLEDLGARQVFAAQDGQSALELLATLAEPIDIIVSDLDMPGMDGMELVRHVAELGKPVALILTTSLERSLLSSVENMARAYGVRLLAALEKPLTPKKLEAALLAFAAQAPAASAAEPAPTMPVGEILEGLDAGEFAPWFEPKADIATGRVVGAEALARWHHPARGLVMPQAFVPVLEREGAIDRLTELMVEKAAAACRTWRDTGVSACVSINLSPISTSDMGLAERLIQLVEAQGLEPREVIFEITESAATTDQARVMENLSRLRMKGYGLAIDDYGTGYASMQQLTRIPFTELKVDQSFVKYAATQPGCRAVVESSLEIAGKLGLATVAEGVETHREWELVRSLGCRFAQGYYVGRAMAAPEFLAWARAHGGMIGP